MKMGGDLVKPKNALGKIIEEYAWRGRALPPGLGAYLCRGPWGYPAVALAS